MSIGRPPTLFVTPGQRIGRGTVIDPEIRVTGNKRGALLRCDCGNTYQAALLSLVERNGRINTTSCGCAQREAAAVTGRSTIEAAKAAWVARQPGQGLSAHPLHATWHAVRNRCESSANPRYLHYGGRGIQVCDRWQDVRQFIADIEAEIGPHPGRGYSLDRKNNDGDYEPGNVRWATYSQQNRNRQPRSGRMKGASQEQATGKWVARVHLGRFDTEAQASDAYRRAVGVLEREGILT